MNILIISASPRKGSLSLRFAHYLKTTLIQFQTDTEVRILNFEEFDIPLSGRAILTRESLTGFQQELISSWEKAQIIFFCLPEYNWSTNGEVFIMLDQLGGRNFAHLFDEKIFAMIGVSSGRGGRIPALEVGKVVEKLISFLGKLSIVSPKIFEAHDVGKNLSELSVSSGNQVLEREVDDFVLYTYKLYNRWVKGAPQIKTRTF